VVVNAFEGQRTLQHLLKSEPILFRIVDGIKTDRKVRTIAGELAETVKTDKEALSIRSPSQVMREYGLNNSEG
jgi:hypothetical protein